MFLINKWTVLAIILTMATLTMVDALPVIASQTKQAPTAKPLMKATATPAAKSATKAVVKTTTQPIAKTAVKSTAKPTAKATTKPAAKVTNKPAAKPAVKANAKPTIKPKAIDLAVLQQKLIVLPKSSYDETEAQAMIDRIMSINPNVLHNFVNNGGKIKLITTNITGDPAFAHLKNKTPRGWEDTGLTWDDVPGIGGKLTVVKIGASALGNGHGSVCLELHELAHGLDQFAFGDISQSASFNKLTKKDKALFEFNPYYAYDEEFFAEAFAMYFFSEETRKNVKEKAPNVYAFIQKLVNP